MALEFGQMKKGRSAPVCLNSLDRPQLVERNNKCSLRPEAHTARDIPCDRVDVHPQKSDLMIRLNDVAVNKLSCVCVYLVSAYICLQLPPM